MEDPLRWANPKRRHNPLTEQLLTSDDLDNLPEPDWLIGNLIPRGALVVVYGLPGSYKSFAALDWALCVATGTKWAGWDVKQGVAIYVAAEGIAGTPWRKQAWQHDRDIKKIGDAYWLPCSVNLLEATPVEDLLDMVDEKRPTIVVLDTLARNLVGGDENSAGDIGKAMWVAERINRTGATVVVVHHTLKSGENYRGSSALEGAAATMVKVEGEGTGAVKFTCTKQKDALPIEPILMQAVPVLHSVVLKVLASSENLRRAEQTLLASLAEEFGELEVSPGPWELAAGVTGNTFLRARKVLVERGFVRNVGTKARPRYAITEEGTRQHAITRQPDFG